MSVMGSVSTLTFYRQSLPNQLAASQQAARLEMTSAAETTESAFRIDHSCGRYSQRARMTNDQPAYR